jgi:hypothetical protein
MEAACRNWGAPQRMAWKNKLLSAYSKLLKLGLRRQRARAALDGLLFSVDVLSAEQHGFQVWPAKAKHWRYVASSTLEFPLYELRRVALALNGAAVETLKR